MITRQKVNNSMYVTIAALLSEGKEYPLLRANRLPLLVAPGFSVAQTSSTLQYTFQGSKR